MSLVPEIIEKLKENNVADTFVVREGNFIGSLTKPSATDGKGEKQPLYKHPLFRFLVLVAVLLVCIALLTCLIAFLSMDMLLHRNDYFVNNNGTIVTRRDCNKETSIFLLNASELWHNTGIQLNEGDKFCITWSGGCYGAIDDLNDKVLKNKRPSYGYVSPGRVLNALEPGSEFCMYKGTYCDTTAYFGQLLYQIQANECDLVYDEPLPSSKCWIKRLESNQQIFSTDAFIKRKAILKKNHSVKFKNKDKVKKLRAKRNGTLFVSINDLYLSETTINSIFAKDHLTANDTITKSSKTEELLCEEVPRLLSLKAGQLKDTLIKTPDLFFEDNLGNMLVCVEVYHKSPGIFSFILRPFSEKGRHHWLIGMLVLLPFLFIGLDRLINKGSRCGKRRKMQITQEQINTAPAQS